MKSLKKKVLVLLALLAFFAVAAIILAADRGKLPAVIAGLYAFPYGDKLGHFLLMGLLAFFLALALPERLKRAGLAVLAVILVLEEGSQSFLPNRNFSGMDLLCSLLGVLVFGGLAVYLSTCRRTSKPAPPE